MLTLFPPLVLLIYASRRLHVIIVQ